MTNETPVISLWMPWANWVSLGWKTVETRTHRRFKSLEGKRIGIHASLKWDNDALTLARPFLDEEKRIRTQSFSRIGGAVICTAFIEQHKMCDESESRSALIDCGSTLRYGLILSNVEIIEAIPCKGKQGIFYIPQIGGRQ